MLSQKRNNHLLIFLALLFASIVSTTTVMVRALYSGRLMYTFLVWNLFLAWLPLGFAWLAYQLREKRPYLLITSFFWLLFFPNAPYLLTDFIHLRYGGVVPFWYDAIMLFSFALTGLLLGLLSLYLMQTLVTQRFGRMTGWLFAIMSVGLSGYGVYVGRFLRWNSWDIFAHPFTLLNDILNSLLHPQMVIKTYTVSLLLSAVFMFAYVALLSLSRAALELQPEQIP